MIAAHGISRHHRHRRRSHFPRHHRSLSFTRCCSIDASASHPLDSASASQLPLRLCCLLSSGALLPVCLSFASWLSHRLLLCASASFHLLLRSRLMRPSLTPPSLFSPAGCYIANIQRIAASLLAVSLTLTSTSVEVVIVVVSRRAIAIVVDFFACRVVTIVNGDTFF